ncbi:MAG: bifunctional diaminohydroxyphosphoribosylaminopyrimidine deaminase/5-amino-6-(5-phosphoribosylamino)uracil reductase RibD [Bacteroides sp.]|nr:bifunctional diaminohydroxyphosphoribosylaminopyrimidine deaminase/5-amino-6-(5-phosphoribosylamino)uracil reductase RibD [Bacteroides sp.]MCM1379601.1 bifunctional diaminohydroxyphosphoribosylaminopyrimidine deaminase/5-amino-6-(5-phosphoribosylamino)uracil reductase RibD [Bacteroides sp.]MCM1446017.1 bifunctional diaminohydroxyphosphoribosylaminopyrimidine deaminase/5-amino-6-(5-phosphoribosylamino)uracil reductase RibD [Prevotella sp.]
MWRALELAAKGEIGTHPNPMVGAVIVAADGKIIGEGYHKKCGQAHAEVNAINSVDSGQWTVGSEDWTMYVSLEPCAHYGKTPPCAKLIIEKGIKHVVVGMVDPFAKVHGKGIQMLRDAGVEVTVLDGKIAEACRELNRRFITAHTLGRPYIALKWAQTADGFVDRLRLLEEEPLRISTPESRIAMHSYRSTFDAIAVGSETEKMDRPRLDARLWPGGRDPQRVYLHRGELLPQLQQMYADGITSLLIEGGPTLLRSFIAANLYDEARVEINPSLTLSAGIPAPEILNDERLTILSSDR